MKKHGIHLKLLQEINMMQLTLIDTIKHLKNGKFNQNTKNWATELLTYQKKILHLLSHIIKKKLFYQLNMKLKWKNNAYS